MSRLTRNGSDKIIAGVCSGIASYLEVDAVFVRLAFLVLLFASGIGLPIYLILWVIMPLDNETKPDYVKTDEGAVKVNKNETSNFGRLSKPGTLGAILLLLGGYFFLGRLGLLGWLDGAIFWPLFVIGIGVYLLIQRQK